jgi:hypothetical protein
MPEGVAETSQIFLRDIHVLPKLIHTYRHTYIPLTGIKIPEGVAEACQTLLQDTHVLSKLVSCEEHCRRDRW